MRRKRATDAFLQHIFFETFLVSAELGIEDLELSISSSWMSSLVRGERRSQDFQRTADARRWPLRDPQNYQ